MTCVTDGNVSTTPHPPTGRSQADERHRRLDELADQVEADVIDWRHDIHQHPELSNRETRTAAKIADHLTSLGLEVHTDIAPTGVIGILRGDLDGDRVIALRADIDALPVEETVDVPFKSTVVDKDYPGGPFPVAHSCGHDAHTAMLMGAASVLTAMKSELAGTVLFVFQPAEEGPPVGEQFGAQAMLDADAFADLRPDACFGMHVGPLPAHAFAYASGVQLGASEVLEINIHGQQVHGSTPFAGLDPMPVLAAIDNGFAQIYRQIDTNEPFTISIGKIDTVGRTNIIGGKITAWGTARAARTEVLDDLNMRMKRVVEHAAQMHGLTADFAVHQHVPAMVNEQDWLDRLLPSVERVAGEDNVHIMRPVMGYDDVSVFVKEFGGIYIVLGGQNVRFVDGGLPEAIDPSSPTGGFVPNHNPGFYVLDEVLKTGVRAHAHVALDFLGGA